MFQTESILAISIIMLILVGAVIVILVYKLFFVKQNDNQFTETEKKIIEKVDSITQFVCSNIGNLVTNGNTTLFKEIDSIFQTSNSSLGEHIKNSFKLTISRIMGNIGELQALFSLKEKYIRYIPLGQPIDGIGISADGIDFIEIKTGQSQLTKEEKLIKEHVEAKNVNFVLLRIEKKE